MPKIYETAITVAEMSKVPIYEKSALIGPDALAHRSGIHQDGAFKTRHMEKGAYRPIHPSLIGRDDDEKMGFTSQSGKTAIYEIITRAGYPITIEEAIRISPVIKEKAEKVGELPVNIILDLYFSEIFDVKGPFKLIEFKKQDNGIKEEYKVKFNYDNKDYDVVGHGGWSSRACLTH